LRIQPNGRHLLQQHQIKSRVPLVRILSLDFASLFLFFFISL
jgi:hypothetical protein